MTAEGRRLQKSVEHAEHWKRWGPYLSERAWGTVREDYSKDGAAWDYLPHDHARSRAYRWNEDGLAGICDRHQGGIAEEVTHQPLAASHDALKCGHAKPQAAFFGERP